MKGQGKARTPRNHRHEAQGAKGGKGEKQGVWAVPMGKRGKEKRRGPDHSGGGGRP